MAFSILFFYRARTSLFAAALMCFSTVAAAQKSNSEPTISVAVRDKNLLIIAERVTPLRGSSRMLTQGYYFLQVRGDTLISFLPYFGRQFSVPSPDEMIYGGYQFKTRTFTYSRIAAKKGWEIYISTKPYKDELNISISISGKGWADISIQSSGRDPVSYSGALSFQ